jgi:hypothetical protein
MTGNVLLWHMQHPYGESDEDYLDNAYSEGKPGYVNYFVYVPLCFGA